MLTVNNPSTELRLIIVSRIPDAREARLGLLFQQFVLSRYISSYEQFVFLNDPHQAALYRTPFIEALEIQFYQKIRRLSQAMARVGFLRVDVALIPGAVEAWISLVNEATESIFFRNLSWEELSFFQFTPGTGKLITSISHLELVDLA